MPLFTFSPQTGVTLLISLSLAVVWRGKSLLKTNLPVTKKVLEQDHRKKQ